MRVISDIKHGAGAEKKVLILGSASNLKISELVACSGHTPILSTSLTDAVRQLSSDASYSAVILDSEPIGIDLLECVLNVRDFDQNVRIFALCRDLESSSVKLPSSTGKVFFIRPEEIAEKLRPAIFNIHKMSIPKATEQFDEIRKEA